MRKQFRWVVVVILLFACRAWSQPVEPVVGTVRFTLYWNTLIVANGSVGSWKGLNFLFDTGASPTVIDAALAQKLRLQEEPASLMTVGGRSLAARAIVPNLRLGPAHREQLPVFVEDLSFFEKALPVHIDAVVGLDLLGQNALLIDYHQHTLRFGPAPVLENALPLHLNNGLAVISSMVNGRAAHLVLDTGAAALTLFTSHPSQLPGAVRVSQKGASPQAIGEAGHKQATLRSLQLGTTDFGRQTASLVANGPPDADIDGLVNPAALGVRVLAIDLIRGEVAFVR